MSLSASPEVSRETPVVLDVPYEETIPANPTLEQTVRVLAGEIGTRNLVAQESLERARSYLTARLERAGYKVELQSYFVASANKWAHNIVAERKGSGEGGEIVILGAHYDSVYPVPGANDNGSGTAALLHLAERFADTDFEKTVRFVFFVNEEPPYFQTEEMGSAVYAKACSERGDRIVGMLSLETIGYYSDKPGSQQFPTGVSGYPDTGNFLAFICDPESKLFMEECVKHFAGFPRESLVAPRFVKGVDWSDHASFWKYGYPAVMVTDTAPFRYPHYHLQSDTPDKLDYPRFEKAVSGLAKVTAAIAGAKETPSETQLPDRPR